MDAGLARHNPGMAVTTPPVRPGPLRRLHGALLQLALLLAAAAVPPWMPTAAAQKANEVYDRAFERDLFKNRLLHEVEFRAAAIHVAWGAEALCHATTEIEPFVLWSVHAMRERLSSSDLALFKETTLMDEKWRIVWLDESAPPELDLRDVVVAVNDRKLPDGGTRFEFSALFRGGSVVSNDDQAFWDVMLKARQEAAEGKPMQLTLEDGRKVTVPTQKGCAGSVTASSFDNDPDKFWRVGNQRVKIPASAMLEASHKDEFRWLAAFGTYFQASQSAIAAVQRSEGVSNGFLVGKILAITIPGAGMLLSAAEAQAEKAIAVDSIVGSADLFANEVVVSLGGDASAGLRLTERMLRKGVSVEAVTMDDFRRSNAAEHARRIKALQALQAERERAERLAEEQAQAKAQAAAAAAAGLPAGAAGAGAAAPVGALPPLR